MRDTLKKFRLFQTFKNIISNVLLFGIQVLISLWYTPYLFRQLGSELFGFIPLANSVINYLSILTHSLNISVGRHITIELEKGEITHANEIFNANLVATFLLISAVIPLGALMVILAPQFLIIPITLERDVRFLFIGIIAAFLLATYRINFTVATFARNRFDLRNFVALGARIAQILIIVGLFNLSHPSLAYIGLGTALATLLNLAGDYYLWQILLPVLKVNLRVFRKKNLKMLLNTGTWIFFYQIGFLLFLNVDMFIANRFLDLNLVGMYGALLVIPKNLRILSMAIGGVWGPLILSKFSQADYLGMDKIVYTAVKLTGLTLALPIGLICGLVQPFLIVWLGPDFVPLSWVLIWMLLPLCINLLDGPFFNIEISFGKLKVPALFTFGFGILNLLMSIYLTPRFGVMGLVSASAITLTANSSIFTPLFVARIMGLPWWHYLRQLVIIVFATLSVAGVSYLLSRAIPITSFLHLLFASGLISTGYIILVYFWGLSSSEKNLLSAFVLPKQKTNV